MGNQMLDELVAARTADGVETLDVAAIGRDLRHHHILDLVEAGVIDFRGPWSRRRDAAASLTGLRPVFRRANLLILSIWYWCFSSLPRE
jgi:hypothetical protein